ncbi:MAG: GAP family protein [Patescibacteria group bacterium]
MPTPIILTLLSIALVDSINPSAIVMTLVQLNGPKKVVANALSYIFGIFCTYYIIGVILLYAYHVIGSNFKVDLGPISNFFSSPPAWAYLAQFVLGIVMLVYAFIFFRKKDNQFKDENKRSSKSSLLGSFVLGVLITGVEAGTAIPYFGAISTLYIANPGLISSAVMLFFYNIVFVLPPLLIVVLYLMFRSQFGVLIERINLLQSKYSFLLIKYGMIIIGVLLLIDSIVQFK